MERTPKSGKDIFTYTVTTPQATPAHRPSRSISSTTRRRQIRPATLGKRCRRTQICLSLSICRKHRNLSGVGGLTKFQLAEQAILNLMQQYDTLGHVKVELVTFSDTARNASGGWVDLSDPTAKANLTNIILGLSASGSTNYAAALTEDMADYASSGKLTGSNVQNVAYFLSDGQPTSGDEISGGLNTGRQGTWTSFLNTDDMTPSPWAWAQLPINRHSSGIESDCFRWQGRGNRHQCHSGDGPQPAHRNIGFHRERRAGERQSDWRTVCQSRRRWRHFLSLVVNGVDGAGSSTTYTFDPSNPTPISVSGTNHEISFDASTDILTVQTVSGTLALDMGGANVGQYIYTPSASVTSATEQFGYNVIDGDGDTAGSTLTVTISPPAASATNQVLIGGSGADTLNGGQGDDILDWRWWQ